MSAQVGKRIVCTSLSLFLILTVMSGASRAAPLEDIESAVGGLSGLTASAGPVAPDASKIIYNTFGFDPTYPYDYEQGWAVMGIKTGAYRYIAMPFIPTESGTIRKVVIALGAISKQNNFTVTLRRDSAGLPGAKIRSFSVRASPWGTCCEVQTAVIDGTRVAAGTKYWLATSALGKTDGGWYFSSTGTLQAYAFGQRTRWEPSFGEVSAFALFGELDRR